MGTPGPSRGRPATHDSLFPLQGADPSRPGGGDSIKNILITGGSGFIGSHLAHALVRGGHHVRVLDNKDPQVHGPSATPLPLPEQAEEIEGDVRDEKALDRALEDIDAVYHFAAAVGVGQSMYEIKRYVETNSLGTANLMESLADRPVDRLVVASSMSVYGEGLYRDQNGKPVMDARRDPQQVKQGRFDPIDEKGEVLIPRPTSESKPPDLESVYALTKYDQERLCLMLGRSSQIPTTALRFFNVYGPGQTLGNPYTGVLAIFATRILNGRPPIVFEDGRQRRDFVHVDDVVRACTAALASDSADGHAINVGSGESIEILRLAEKTLETLGRDELRPQVTHEARLGDIRNCFADITLARRLLGYDPRVPLEKGLAGMTSWLKQQEAEDQTEAHVAGLRERGLFA